MAQPVMEFEDILKDVGDFGKYQIILIFIFLVPAATIFPWISLNVVFVTSTPDHWCRVSELDDLDIFLEDQKRLIRPPADPFCTRYAVNFTNILQSDNLTVDPNWPVKKCDSGWIYDTSNYDETAVTKWNLVCDDEFYKSTIVSFVFLGAVFGTPIFGFLSDIYGRKKMFLSVSLLLAVVEMISAFSPNLMVFIICRLLIGSTMACLYALGYILILELVRSDLRGRINGITTNCWTFGMCILPLTAYLTRSWIYLSIVMSVISACAILYCRVLPESPRWLISRERYAEAAKVLEKISITNNRTIKYEQLLRNIQTLGKLKKEGMNKKCSVFDFFRYPVLRKRFILCSVTWIGVALPYYGLQLNVTNLYGNEFLNFFFVAIVELPAHLVAWWLLANVGRKKGVQFGLAVTAVSCLVPVFFYEESVNVGVIVSIIAKAGASASFMGHYQLVPEVFPTSLRGVGMSLTTTIGTGCTFIIPYITQLKKHGSFIPFLAFSAISIIAGVCSVFLPETMNTNLPHTVEDVEKLGKNEKCFSCRCSENEYNLENKISSNLPDSVPAFTIYKENL